MNTNSCQCGCGAEVKNRFAQGHDAKLKSQLLAATRTRQWWTREAAVLEMVERNWGHFVDPQVLATTPVRSRHAGRFVRTVHIDGMRFGYVADAAGDIHSHHECPSIQGSSTWTREANGWLCSTCIHTADHSELMNLNRMAA